ncbi:MAG: metallophosphoesterase family protein [Gammaproteobacteria bacterium]
MRQFLGIVLLLIIGSAQASVRFVAFGDFGFNDAKDEDVAALVDELDPDFIVTVGDNRYVDDIDLAIGRIYSDYIGDYQGNFGPGSEINRFFPSIGNHEYSELGGLDVYLDYFNLPGDNIPTSGTSGNERYYDFIQGPVHFFVINSYRAEPDRTGKNSVQAQWLQAQLAASSSPWKIVISHYSPHTSLMERVYLMWPWEEWGVDVYMAGHEHRYEKFIVDGFPYMIVGTGHGKGATLVTADDETLHFEYHDVEFGVVDQHTLSKRQFVEIDVLPDDDSNYLEIDEDSDEDQDEDHDEGHDEDGSMMIVEVKGSAEFDAAEVDASLISFGPIGAYPFDYPGTVHDRNEDGFDDMDLTFRIADTGIVCDMVDELVELKGETYDGSVEFIAWDFVSTSECEGDACHP